MQKNGETKDVLWATLPEARELISHTTNVEGKARDLRTLDGAFKEWWTLVAQSPNRASES